MKKQKTTINDPGSDWIDNILPWTGAFVLVVLLMAAVWHETNKAWERDAIEHDKGVYVLEDRTSKSVTFRWLPRSEIGKSTAYDLYPTNDTRWYTFTNGIMYNLE